MNVHLEDAWHTLAAPQDNPHGPLPRLLVLLTMITGLVDAFSFLELGRIFVANMTGNVVFLSFALGGAPGFLWWASLLAIGAFSLGAFIGGRIAAAHGHHRGRHLLVGSAAEGVFVLAAFVFVLVRSAPYDRRSIVVLGVLLAIGMGIQNATARKLGVPDMNTTVLTGTITGISADIPFGSEPRRKAGRRLVTITSMFIGGFVGALLISLGAHQWVLLVATLLLAVTIVVALREATTTAAWARK
jgi:uncharacterized membrane protein YoaK (UPF0700 family)